MILHSNLTSKMATIHFTPKELKVILEVSPKLINGGSAIITIDGIKLKIIVENTRHYK
jgi:hypothetical protein